MKGRRGLGLLAGVAVIGAAGAAVAFLLLSPGADVTTSSKAAYREYVAGSRDLQRLYIADARRHFLAALQADPRFASAMAQLALVDVQTGEREEAARLLKEARARRSFVTRKERLLIDLAGAAYDRDLPRLTSVATSLARDYHSPIAYALLAGTASEEGDVDGTRRICLEWLAADPNAAPAYNLLGYAEANRGDYEGAITNLEKYAFMAPDEANPFDSLGEVETAFGHYDEAVRDLRKALSIKPDFDASRLHLAEVDEARGDFAEARRACEEFLDAHSASPLAPQFLFLLARAEIRQRDLAAANATIAKIAALRDPALAEDAKLFEAVAAAYRGDYAAAMERYNAFRPEAQGKLTAAQAELTQRMRLSILARVALLTGHYAEAEQATRQILESRGSFLSMALVQEQLLARALRARALAHLGKIAEARALIEQNRKINPNDLETLEAEKSLEPAAAKGP